MVLGLFVCLFVPFIKGEGKNIAQHQISNKITGKITATEPSQVPRSHSSSREEAECCRSPQQAGIIIIVIIIISHVQSALIAITAIRSDAGLKMGSE